jgi:ankyrin repeat protein
MNTPAVAMQRVVVTGSANRAPQAAVRAAPLQRPVPGADPDALRQAAAGGNLTALGAQLANASDIDARDAEGRTALMLATLNGRTDAVTFLLAHGADPRAADAHGTTPLQAAIAADEREIIAALKRYGAR